MPSTSALIVVDGSHGEGGGALLRTALTMSVLTQQAVRIEQVRGSTKYPGLDPEDLTLISALASTCRADVVGAEPGSGSLTFMPTGKPRGLSARLETFRTPAGRGPNAQVVLGALLPVLARSGVYSTLTASGETHGFHTLSFDYFNEVTLRALKKIGLFATADLLIPGFGRDSDGEVSMGVEPSALSAIDWPDRRSLRSVRATVTTSGLQRTFAERAESHLKSLASQTGLTLDIESNIYHGTHAGAHVTVWAVYERGMGGGTATGIRGLRPETLAQEAFEKAFEWMACPATVDSFLADQILLPLVFADGVSVVTVPRLTQRLLTAIWVVKQFAPIHITVRGIENGPGSISVGRSG